MRTTAKTGLVTAVTEPGYMPDLVHGRIDVTATNTAMPPKTGGTESVASRAVMPKQRSSMWSLKVDTAEEALALIREAAGVFYGLSALLAVASFLLGSSVLWNAAIFAILGFWLHRRCSRIAAAFLVLDAAGAMVVTVSNLLTQAQGGRNIFLATIVLWTAIRATVACFKLPRLVRREQVAAV